MYKKEYGVFQVFIRHTDQKQLLVKNILKWMNKNKKTIAPGYVFTDIGAGDGTVTGPIVDYLHGLVDFTCNYIEPSRLAVDFRNRKRKSNIHFIAKDVNKISIPKSNFILSSHVLIYLKNYFNVLLKIYKSLKSGGVALVVLTNKTSGDNLIKKKLTGRDSLSLAPSIISFLEKNKIRHRHQIVKSLIDFSCCEKDKITHTCKSMISFVYHKNLESLTQKDCDKFLLEARKHFGRKDRLVKKEDYIWLFKG